MLATNLIPNDLRYQLEFKDLPARAEALNPLVLEQLLGNILGGIKTLKTCRKNFVPLRGKPNCPPGYRCRTVRGKAIIFNKKLGLVKFRKGPHGRKPPKIGLNACVKKW